MRLDRVWIDGFRNLKDVSIDFEETRLTTVVIGQNGAGKSNLIEAIVDVFRYVDLNERELKPRFRYEVDYRIGNHKVQLSNRHGEPAVSADSELLTRAAFERRRDELFPDLVFGYYSGGGRRLERLFDRHQQRYYRDTKTEDDAAKCGAALTARHLFYCRPIHGAFALLSLFAFPDEKVNRLLLDDLGISNFHSALALLREPWFAKGKRKTAKQLWGAGGPAGQCASHLREHAFHPLAFEDDPRDDYRDKNNKESQLACFLRDIPALKSFAQVYSNEQELFYALEAVDISDLIRELYVWVTRANDSSGDVSFGDLSDGERQLLMVLGLIRMSRGKRALFLLDEPDTHLNPAWQHGYLDKLKEWTAATADANNCHLILTSHNPLTIAGLEKEEVRVMFADKAGQIFVKQPVVDPRGLGFSGVLTDIFGMPSTLDRPTQELIDQRNRLARIASLSEAQAQKLEQINSELRSLGFMYEERDELYRQFLRSASQIERASAPPLTPDELRNRDEATRELLTELMGQK
jgi:predicted ATPase